jgi:hypothetical protein
MKYIISIIVLIITFFVGYQCGKTQQGEVQPDTIAPKIERIVTTKDSILRINDSIDFKVKEIEKVHETTIDDIIRNNPADDYNFFSTYIERYCGYNNTDTTQESESNIR